MKKVFMIISIIFGIFFVAVVGYGIYLYISLTSTANEMHEPLDRPISDKRENEVNVEEREPLSFLITGIDTYGDSHSGRTDTIIVMTVNPKEQSVKMLSLPRDTRTEIIGRGTLDKINHAHAFGGIPMTINTVENFLDIPIDHYISINMEGFKGIVDALGGVTVHNSFSFSHDGHTFHEGPIELNGDQALSYARMRKNDPRGDFGRNDRQRQIVEAVIQKAANIGSITKVGSILDALGQSVRTDLTLNNMWSIQSNYREARHSVEQMEIKGSGTMINGIYYLQIPDDETARVRTELRTHLNLN